MPPMIPPIVHVIQRWRETSSSTSIVSSGARPRVTEPGGPASGPERRASSWRNSASLSGLSLPDLGLSPLARPVSGELADAGLDLVEGDMAETSCRNDLLTIYHDVGDGARRER